MTVEGHTCKTWEIKPSLDAIDRFHETELHQEKQNSKDLTAANVICSSLVLLGTRKPHSFPPADLRSRRDGLPSTEV